MAKQKPTKTDGRRAQVLQKVEEMVLTELEKAATECSDYYDSLRTIWGCTQILKDIHELNK